MKGMGTTIVAATIEGRRLLAANVGDSRLYLAGDQMIQITRDHSLVQEMVRLGAVSYTHLDVYKRQVQFDFDPMNGF